MLSGVVWTNIRPKSHEHSFALHSHANRENISRDERISSESLKCKRASSKIRSMRYLRKENSFNPPRLQSSSLPSQTKSFVNFTPVLFLFPWLSLAFLYMHRIIAMVHVTSSRKITQVRLTSSFTPENYKFHLYTVEDFSRCTTLEHFREEIVGKRLRRKK